MTEVLAEAPPLAERSANPAFDVPEIAHSVGDVVTTAIQRCKRSAITLNQEIDLKDVDGPYHRMWQMIFK